MIGWLKGIFDWLAKQLLPVVTGLWKMAREFAWMWAALLLAILAPISYAIDYWVRASYFVMVTTRDMFTMVQSVGPSQASGMWGALQSGAALMNCVVALDYGIALGTMVIGLWVMLMTAKFFVWIYKLIPFKFS
jgi:hypothetical protein